MISGSTFDDTPATAAKNSVLVTGASGFLGGAVCRALHAAGWRVIATGRDQKRLTSIAVHAAETVIGDLADPAFVATLPTTTAIVHCAALSSPWGSKRDFQSANVNATAHLIAHAQRIRAMRFVLISSPTVYHRSSTQLDVTERTPWPRHPINHYAASKRETEDMIRASGLTSVILRPRALFGPGDTVLLPRILRAAQEGKLPIIGDGLAITDLTYIDNAADAVRLALTHPLDRGSTDDFNITNGEQVTLWPVLFTLLDRLGLPRPKRHMPLRVVRLAGSLAEVAAHFTRREPSLTRYGAEVLGFSQTFDITKARTVLGFHPAVSVAAGIECFAEWWLREQRAKETATDSIPPKGLPASRRS